ncbi:hypothetical protein [Streptomyces sp. NPDC056049]|uniref:hypothetical protein n=1 Tax=Streptomyces sp. NPDC056049 TaxID=3345693 RepID=UPI0035E2D21E
MTQPATCDRAGVERALKDTRIRALIDAADAVEAAADAEQDYYAPQGMYQAVDLLRRMAEEAGR